MVPQTSTSSYTPTSQYQTNRQTSPSYAPASISVVYASIFSYLSVKSVISTSNSINLIFNSIVPIRSISRSRTTVSAIVPEFTADPAKDSRRCEVTLRMLLAPLLRPARPRKVLPESPHSQRTPASRLHHTTSRQPSQPRRIQRRRIHNPRRRPRTPGRRIPRPLLPARNLRPTWNDQHHLQSPARNPRKNSSHRRRSNFQKKTNPRRSPGRKRQRPRRSSRTRRTFLHRRRPRQVRPGHAAGEAPILRPETIALFTRREPAPSSTPEPSAGTLPQPHRNPENISSPAILRPPRLHRNLSLDRSHPTALNNAPNQSHLARLLQPSNQTSPPQIPRRNNRSPG